MTIQQISQSFNEMISTVFASTIAFLPRLFWSVILAGIGWFAAWILKKITLQAIHGLDQLLERKAAQKGQHYIHIKQSFTRFIGEAVFWVSLIFFLVLAIQILQLEILSSFLDDVLKSLPLLGVAIVIIVASFFIASICRQIVSSALHAMEIEQADLFGNGIRILVILVGILLGVAQIGIDISFLATIISISFATFLGAIALAFGLGAKVYVSNILSSVQIRRIYQNGDTVMIDNSKGKIIEISSTMVLLQSDEGQIAMPAKLFQEKISLLYGQAGKDETR